MKFAVIETGAKQYKVSEGDIIKVEKLSRTEVASSATRRGGGNNEEKKTVKETEVNSNTKNEEGVGFKEGDKITFNKVLLVDDGKDTKVGEPYLEGVKVEAKFIEEARAPKIVIMQFKSKSNYLKRKGHKQTFHKVEITKI